jgi:hypothetical protein
VSYVPAGGNISNNLLTGEVLVARSAGDFGVPESPLYLEVQG